MALVECLDVRGETPPRPEGLSRYGVTCGWTQLLVIPSDRLPTALPNFSSRERLSGVGSAVISRYLADISAGPPQMLRCQTLPSMWTLGKDEPVIPGVPFIR